LLTFVMGLLADLLNHNRQLIEMTLEKVRKLEDAARTGRVEDPVVPVKQPRSAAKG
jgi:hypothetical protein